MSAQTKVSGAWRNMSAPYVKVSGSWRIAKSAWTKIDEKWRNWFLQGGVLDAPLGNEENFSPANFNTNLGSSTGIAASVNSIAIQSDGKIVLGGTFTTFNGATVNRIVRLNSDGTRDTAFSTNTGTGANDVIFSRDIQTDGKILLGGSFTTFNDATVNRIVRLNADGTVDTAFSTNTGTGANSIIFSIVTQSDGKILLGGSFTTFNGATVNRIVRLNADGTVDTAFSTNTGTGMDNIVYSIVTQSAGKILLGGLFTTFNGTTTNRILRLNSDGTRDTDFMTNVGTGANDTIFSIVTQSDGKILLGGNFTTFNGTTTNRILRLNSDGTRDTDFMTNVGTGANNTISLMAIQSDGKILLGGTVNSINNISVNSIARLNANGTVDASFTSNTGTGPLTSPSRVVVQPDGNILLGGGFSTFDEIEVRGFVRLNSNGEVGEVPAVSGLVRNIGIQSNNKILLVGDFYFFNSVSARRIVRLNSDLTLDTDFMTNIGTALNSNAISIAIQSDDKILIGGDFTDFNGTSSFRTVRLNANGTMDTAFRANTGGWTNNRVISIAVQSDGKILFGGSFTTFNDATVNRIARLNADGTVDTAFITNIGTGFNSSVNSIAIQSDGKILVGGAYSNFNGTTTTRIVRLNADGTRDATFVIEPGFSFGANNTVNSVAIQSDGKILLGGDFTSFNGVSARRIVRLNADATRDTAFNTNTGTGADATVNSVAVQTDGKILLGGSFTTFNDATVNRIVRLNSDGTRDTAFSTNTGTGANDVIFSIVTQSAGKILLGGLFTVFNALLRFRVARIGGDFAV